MLFRFNGAIKGVVTQLAFSPSQNMLAWTDMDGVLTRWPNPIPATSPSPVTVTNASSSNTVPVKRGVTPSLFDDDLKVKRNADADMDEDLGEDLDNEDWILDDLGDGMADDDKKWAGKDGIREMGKMIWDFVLCQPVLKFL